MRFHFLPQRRVGGGLGRRRGEGVLPFPTRRGRRGRRSSRPPSLSPLGETTSPKCLAKPDGGGDLLHQPFTIPLVIR